MGVANLCSAAFGGYTSCISLSRTLLNHSMGARTRLSGVIVAALCAFALAVDPALLGYVPKYVLGGLLLYLGGMLIYQWLITSALRLSIPEYLSLLAIAAIIVEWGFIAGVLSGVVIGCATFALSASRVNAIKYSFDGSEIRSSLDRSPDELAVLTKNGTQIQVMALHSYLFFGSANGLHEHIKALLARHPECRFLVFDFRLVNGVDSSATHSFTQIKRAADERGARLVLVNLTPELGRAFRSIGFLTEDILLDAGPRPGAGNLRRRHHRGSATRPAAKPSRCMSGWPRRSAMPSTPTFWSSNAFASRSLPAILSRGRATLRTPCTSSSMAASAFWWTPATIKSGSAASAPIRRLARWA